jgi:hypothetical protein
MFDYDFELFDWFHEASSSRMLITEHARLGEGSVQPTGCHLVIDAQSSHCMSSADNTFHFFP